MRINSHNIKNPTQSPYAFIDGELHSDPAALGTYLAGKAGRNKCPLLNGHVRAWERTKRTQRLAERARKEQRHNERARKDFIRHIGN